MWKNQNRRETRKEEQVRNTILKELTTVVQAWQIGMY